MTVFKVLKKKKLYLYFHSLCNYNNENVKKTLYLLKLLVLNDKLFLAITEKS